MVPELSKPKRPIQGVGIGLRACHYSYIREHRPNLAWFEVLADNYFCDGGPALLHLDEVCTHYPVALHGVGMSLGSTDPLNLAYFAKLKQLAKRVQPDIISDHLCWVSVNGECLHELLPLPYTEEAIAHVADRIQRVQEILGQRILIENVSSYLSYADNEMTEWEFLSAVAERADCFILLDINNIYVSAYNHGFDPLTYVLSVDKKRVRQFHLAGYENHHTHLLDTHGAKVYDTVWQLYEAALTRFGDVPTLIEWDTDIPEFTVLEAEVNKAQQVIDRTTRK